MSLRDGKKTKMVGNWEASCTIYLFEKSDG